VELARIIAKVAEGESLTAQEAETAFDHVMAGEASPVQMAALLLGLRARGHAPSEVAGGVRALRRAMIPVPASSTRVLVDTCGTGGGVVTTFNISTAAALVAASAGVGVAKHGNRSFTSRSGSADVLEALGVTIQLTPRGMGQVLDEAGIVFMFAPLLHPAMRHVGPVRRELGVPTIMNVLGPLANPAGVRRQVVGVADPELLPLVIQALQALEHERALVVHGLPGMDELSPLGETLVAELRDGEVREYRVDPNRLGLPAATAEEIAGGEPEENAELILRILERDLQGGARTVTLMNAAAALYVAGLVEGLADGVERAAEAVDSGAARETLERLRTASRRAGAEEEEASAGITA
jgi:anthranilate phosphoribosyltransferase